MTPSAEPGRGAVLAGLILAALVGALLTFLVATGSAGVLRLDDGLSRFTHGWADTLGWPVAAANVVGTITAPFWPGVVVALVVAWLLQRGHPAIAGFLALSGVLGITAASGVKLIVERPRPTLLTEYEIPSSASFPSGHASAGIYLVLALGLVLWRYGAATRQRWLAAIGAVLVAAGPLIGASRLVLGVHWPSDVAAGWAYGSAALCTAALLLWDRLAADWPVSSSAHPRPPHG